MITIERRCHKSKFRKEMEQIGNAARRISAAKLESAGRFYEKKEKAENKLKGAAIRRYAKKNHLHLEYHPKPWVFYCLEHPGISMPAGYFAVVDRVIHQIVAQ